MPARQAVPAVLSKERQGQGQGEDQAAAARSGREGAGRRLAAVHEREPGVAGRLIA